MQRLPALVLCLAIGCAAQTGSAPPARSSPPAAAAPAAANSTSPNADVMRSLGPDATFADLVRAARVLGKQSGGEANARCVLSEASPGYRLDADAMPALDPIPDPPLELDAALQAAPGRLAVLSAWGVLGAPDATLALAAFTATPPQRLRATPSALLLTENGAYLRSGARASSEDDGPLPPEGALARLEADPELAAGPLFVSAEAAVPLSALAALLQALSASDIAPALGGGADTAPALRGGASIQRAVALAVVLPAGTRLPAPSELAALACPEGLPEPAADAPEGEIDGAALAAALRDLVPAAQRCLESARGPGRAGGTFTLALRIGAGGAAEQACVLGGELRDATLVGCVLEVVRGARYPTPSPAGFVDVHAPLRLEPVGWPEPKPYCRAGQ